MVGAVLTQNTAWSNVERAIANLKAAACLEPEAIATCDLRHLGALLRPAGYFNVKARRLQHFCRWYLEQGGYERLRRWPTARLRFALLGVHGIGPETADDILLYAFGRPVFVVDAYTRRLAARLGLVAGDLSYEALRAYFEQALRRETGYEDRPGTAGRRRLVRLYNEYHALIVAHSKSVCRPRPRCSVCCLARHCPAVS